MQEENQKKFNAFKPASLTDWEVAAREELKGDDPWEKLTHNVDGTAILPFYTQKDRIHELPLLPVSAVDFLGARAWYNCPLVQVENEKAANKKALEHLGHGADGIFFELNNKTNFQLLLKDIDVKYCSLNFLAKTNAQDTAAALHTFLAAEINIQESLPISFFGNTLFTGKNPYNHFFSGISIPTLNSPAEEIEACFTSLVKSPHLVSQPLALSITLGTDFFLTIAKIRALRIIWNRLAASKKIKEGLPLFIHGHALPWTKKEYQPHGNMLYNTTAAMAAILGGCDALTLEPEDENHAMMTRVARNVSNILREESFFSKVADPLAGAYYVETLSNQLADKALKTLEIS